MNTVWAFGDSMTAPISGDGPYTEWLGRESKDYCKFVAEEYSMLSENKGVAGSSCNQIFADFLKYQKEIQSGDILIIGWSPVMRYRLAKQRPDKTMMWQQIWAAGWHGGIEEACVDGTCVTKEVAEHIILNRYEFSDFYSDEINDWGFFIKEWAKLKGVKVVFWTWCDSTFGGKHNINVDIPIRTRTDMSVESDGIVKDGHYGEVGHKELADEIVEYLNK